MKRSVLFVIMALAGITAFLSFKGPQEHPESGAAGTVMQEAVQAFPENVSAVFENSCFGCHGPESSNVKAKTKLNFSSWDEMSDAKKVGKIEKIAEVVKGGDMPPAKFLEKYPDRALNQEQKDIIAQWAAAETKKLLGE